METQVKDKKQKMQTTKFGPAVNTGEPITFRYGIPGFEQLRKFILRNLEKYPPFQLFCSLEENDLSMIVLNAKYLKELKDISIPRHELNKIGIDDPQNMDMYVILRVKPDSKQFVANTKAPLIINNSNQTGNQIIIEKDGLMSDYPLDINNQKNVDK